MKEGKLRNAAPLDKGSRIVRDDGGILKDCPLSGTNDIIVGYFHIVAKDLQEALDIAKANPIFRDILTRIEVHMIRDMPDKIF